MFLKNLPYCWTIKVISYTFRHFGSSSTNTKRVVIQHLTGFQKNVGFFYDNIDNTVDNCVTSEDYL